MVLLSSFLVQADDGSLHSCLQHLLAGSNSNQYQWNENTNSFIFPHRMDVAPNPAINFRGAYVLTPANELLAYQHGNNDNFCFTSQVDGRRRATVVTLSAPGSDNLSSWDDDVHSEGFPSLTTAARGNCLMQNVLPAITQGQRSSAESRINSVLRSSLATLSLPQLAAAYSSCSGVSAYDNRLSSMSCSVDGHPVGVAVPAASQ